MSGRENARTNGSLVTEEFIALEDFSASGAEQLSFSAGDALLVHEQVSADWWWAERSGCFGYVPSTFLHRRAEDVEDAWQDEEYFSSYANLKLHLEMLSDRPRTETYRQVIVSNSASLRGKVVMDLGCGTGIISLFCGRLAKPAAVYAVEASSVAEHTEKLVTVFRSRAEDLTLPSKVDVLVSEWMGNCLLFEFMVESVLRVRDRWLKDGGTMWPSSASLSLVPCQAQDDYSQKMEFWENLYGLDFSCLQPVAQEEFFSKPKFSHQLNHDDCLSTPCDVISLDMHTLRVSDLEKLRGEFRFTIERSGTLHGFTAWFSTFFRSLDEGGSTLELNTGPHAESTHWKQTLFMLDRPIRVEEGDCVGGAITLQRNPIWRRHMSITIEWSTKRKNDTAFSEKMSKRFPMWR
ncbi:protein arginine N-methyltransferase 2 [Clarias gariepinus]|uniref:protein arginine N-methyltransferase 2 n=1 Tax=Clarias gariepinus TaxID=13013 RepID=UPI00234CF886|nr:protein arginine N-methyltransferase 2 [Clarias gariepinus]